MLRLPDINQTSGDRFALSKQLLLNDFLGTSQSEMSCSVGRSRLKDVRCSKLELFFRKDFETSLKQFQNNLETTPKRPQMRSSVAIHLLNFQNKCVPLVRRKVLSVGSSSVYQIHFSPGVFLAGVSKFYRVCLNWPVPISVIVLG